MASAAPKGQFKAKQNVTNQGATNDGCNRVSEPDIALTKIALAYDKQWISNGQRPDSDDDWELDLEDAFDSYHDPYNCNFETCCICEWREPCCGRSYLHKARECPWIKVPRDDLISRLRVDVLRAMKACRESRLPLGPSTKTRSFYDFVWFGSGSEVCVTGSFDNWSMTQKLEKKNGVHHLRVYFPKACDMLYKFVIDGEWQCDQQQAVELDGSGNLNNVLPSKDLSALTIIRGQGGARQDSNILKEVLKGIYVGADAYTHTEGITITKFVGCGGLTKMSLPLTYCEIPRQSTLLLNADSVLHPYWNELCHLVSENVLYENGDGGKIRARKTVVVVQTEQAAYFASTYLNHNDKFRSTGSKAVELCDAMAGREYIMSEHAFNDKSSDTAVVVITSDLLRRAELDADKYIMAQFRKFEPDNTDECTDAVTDFLATCAEINLRKGARACFIFSRDDSHLLMSVRSHYMENASCLDDRDLPEKLWNFMYEHY